MKIYINQDGQAAGPFSPEELRNKIYSGELAWTDHGCVEGSQEWLPLQNLLPGGEPPGLPAAPPPLLAELSKLRDPKEKTALVWLYIASVPVWLFIIVLVVTSYGTILIWAGLFWLFGAFGTAWFAAYLKSNAVRVSESQLPELHRAAQNCCRRLNMEMPDIYVIQHNVWNAFAVKFFSRRVVVLFSGAVDSILLKGDMAQLSWVIGHELGHHWAGHLDWKQKIARLGGWLVWVNFWHSRRRELTCDRIGLFCSGSLRSSQVALANLTVGAQLAASLNPDAAAAQWEKSRKEFFVRYRTFYSTYPPLLARMESLNRSAQEFGMPR